MIYLKATGRLGNQLFQYAFIKYLQKHTGQDIAITFDRVRSFSKEKNDGWDNSLNDFLISDYKEIYYYQKKYMPLWIKLKITRKFIELLQKYRLYNGHGELFGVIYCYNPQEQKFELIKNKNYIVDGLFEYDYIVNDIFEQIVGKLTNKELLTETGKNFLNKIENQKTICLSVRKFDLEDLKFKDYFQVCGREYYYKALDYILQFSPNAKIVVFSDAVQWCKENLYLENRYKNTQILYECDDLNLNEKLVIMAQCSHFVISNSTFSWWAQKLGNNKSKIVCAPKKWNRDYYTKNIGLYNQEWILIDNE